MPTRLAFEWLHACSGCEIGLLNCGERLLELLDLVEIVHFPLLMDHKYVYRADGEVDLPEADIGLVSGGVASEEQLALLRAMRRRCRVLVGLGTCATHGGIPALRNQWPVGETQRTVFGGHESLSPVPEALGKTLDRVYSVDELVQVDTLVPGCPPRPETIVAVIETLMTGESPSLETKSVCDTCPTIRTGKGQCTVHRFLANADYDPKKPVAAMRCLLEQGLLCMGPVTTGGCGGADPPLCIRARVPCRGCYGPVRAGGNPLLDILNALASNGIEHRTIVDRKSLLRFCGAHGLLKPLKKKG